MATSFEHITDRGTVRFTSSVYIKGVNPLTVVELGGKTVVLGEDEMLTLHAQLARALGFTD